ncbi:MAG: hypothetical protein K6T83_01075 [Alicyclobacillus sp.]|nr:hypothetical protein [Alicyclobacillus sp.]
MKGNRETALGNCVVCWVCGDTVFEGKRTMNCKMCQGQVVSYNMSRIGDDLHKAIVNDDRSIHTKSRGALIMVMAEKARKRGANREDTWVQRGDVHVPHPCPSSGEAGASMDANIPQGSTWQGNYLCTP